jgi:hypothetical protein
MADYIKQLLDQARSNVTTLSEDGLLAWSDNHTMAATVTVLLALLGRIMFLQLPDLTKFYRLNSMKVSF